MRWPNRSPPKTRMSRRIPVDRYEAFSALLDRGLTTDQIADRYSVEKKIIRQALALGQLAPDIRNAWREGQITGDIAQLFTLAENEKQQIKVFERLQKRPGGLERLDTQTVRKQFTGSEAEANKLLKFVGRTAYVDAGGALSEDLFSDGTIVVHDYPKLKRLAEEKLERECTKLTKGEGWSFAEPQLKTSYMGGSHMNVKPEFTAEEKKRLREIEQRKQQIDAERDADSVDIETNLKLSEEEEQLDSEADRIEAAARARAFTEAQKSKGGCIVRIGNDGEVSIDYGVTKPKAQPATSPQGRSSQPTEEDVDWETKNELRAWRDAAAGEALARDARLALASFLASYQFDEGPIGTSYTNIDLEFLPKAKSVELAIATLRKLAEPKLVEFAVQLIANLVSLDSSGDDDGFLELLDQAVLAKAMARRFDAKTYFNGCSKAYMLGVIDEALGSAAQHDTKSKTDISALCVKDVAGAGWLPPELRTPSYKAPTPAKPAADVKPAAKTKAAKKPAKVAAAKKKPAPKKKSRA
jgi:ParB family chromosome partitioning protein